jgi:hypothetical protein
MKKMRKRIPYKGIIDPEKEKQRIIEEIKKNGLEIFNHPEMIQAELKRRMTSK